jgi:hypothetical protein
MIKPCEECGHPFDTEGFSWAKICAKCCYLPDDQICKQYLDLGEGSLECFWAAKGHVQPHKWEGVIGGKAVKVEWLDISAV